MATILRDDAVKLLREKHYFKEESNEKTWEELCERVSFGIAEAEEKNENKDRIQKEIQEAMSKLEFILLNFH